jgi:type IV secretory pathway VirD2 relaxase
MERRERIEQLRERRQQRLERRGMLREQGDRPFRRPFRNEP